MWTFAIAGLIGILCGCMFRAPALVFVSFLSFGGGALMSVTDGSPILQALLTAMLLTATLQFGFLVGAGLCHARQSAPRVRHGDGVSLGTSLEGRSYSR